MSTGFDFPMDDVDPSRPGSGSGGMLPEGGYHFCITEVILQNERGSTQIECEVIEAKDSNLVGRKHNEFLKWPKGEYTEVGNRIAKEQLLAWCYAAKTTSPEEIRERQQARQGFNPAWLDAMLGRHVLGVVKHDAYTDATGNAKTSSKIEGRVWSPDNPKAKGIPGWIPAPTSPAVTTPTTPTVPQQSATFETNPFAGLA